MKIFKTLVKPIFAFFLIASLAQLGCSVSLVGTADPGTLLPPVPSTAVSQNGSIQVFFTDPESPNARNYEGGPDRELAAAINQARLSVDMAAYSFNLWSMRDALVSAEQRGVTVRVVMESDNMDTPEVQDLKDAGIPIVGDQRQGLMHDKYVIIDRSEVWTGSMNFTAGGTYRDNNNLLQIQSSQVAAAYTQNFEDMFTRRLFGSDAVPPTPNPTLFANAHPTAIPSFNLSGIPLELFFPPAEPAAAHIGELIQGAQDSVYFLAYSFTSNDLAQAVIQRAQSGIKVAGVMDEGQIKADQGGEYDHFKQAGLDVRIGGNTHGLMHDKVIIIDQKIVITGSYNFTAAAEDTNDENLVILFSPEIAQKYMDEFRRVQAQALQP